MLKWIFFGAALTSCVANANILPSKSEILSMDKNDSEALIEESKEQAQRVRAIEEIATNYALQVAFLKTLNFHKKRIESAGNELDEIYNFQTLMDLTAGQINEKFKALGLYVMPAVILESTKNLKRNPTGNVLAVNNKEYLIIKHVTLVTAVPSWRDYLLTDEYPVPAPPPPSLMPRSDEERQVWEEAALIGWDLGVEQASIEIKNRSRRLVSDFKGMMNYIKLVDAGVVEPAYVAIDRNPVQISNNGNKLKLNEYVYRVTAPSSFTVPSNWEGLLGDDRSSIKSPNSIGDAIKGQGMVEDDVEREVL